jgi:membrane protease YdiL (CAAX protease family)
MMNPKQTPELKPMPLWMALLYIGIPTVIGAAALYGLLPVLDRAGVPMLWCFVITVVGMFPLLLLAALVAYRLEGRPLTIPGLADRFRLQRLGKREWKWTLGLLIVFVGGQLLLMPTARWLITSLPLPIPEVLPPAIDPRVVSTIPSEFLGVPLAGNWGIALLYFFILCFNVFGEELWWRGYILPRQELVHGKWTWLVHGVLWTLFHLPFWWNLLALLPSTLSLPYVASRLKNTTPGIITHFVLNGLGFLMILLGVLGLS